MQHGVEAAVEQREKGMQHATSLRSSVAVPVRLNRQIPYLHSVLKSPEFSFTLGSPHPARRADLPTSGEACGLWRERTG